MEKNLEKRILQLENELKEFKAKYSTHQHLMNDGTAPLRKNITLDSDQAFTLGNTQMVNTKTYNTTDGINYFGGLVVGEDVRVGNVLKSPNMQLLFRHIPNNANKFSYLYCNRSPLVASGEDTISTTAGGNTITINGHEFTTNELAGSYINIYASTGALVETHTIDSNTSTVVTITDTWINSTSGGYFQIYAPVFLGSTDNIFRRLYVDGGSATGGVRFGTGVTGTANNKNGLLYMDASGDLYWKYANGGAVKLN